MAERRLVFQAICGVTDLAQLHHEVRLVEALVAAQRARLRPVGAGCDHIQSRQPLGMAGDPRQTGVDQQAMAVLHQGVADEA